MTLSSEKTWWQALNPAIYLISILPAIAILMLAQKNTLWLSGLLFATLAVVLLQHAINLFNDVSDWRLGADSQKMDSWVRIHKGNSNIVQTHAVLSFISGGAIGIVVLIISMKLWILMYAVPLVILGYLYNAGKRPLSYTWMGEWVTGLCYGPGVFGCLWMVAGLEVNTTALLGMAAFAALAMALLLSHQPPQIETDRSAGKHSFAVRYGVGRTYNVSQLLYFMTFMLLGAGLTINSNDPVFLTGCWLVISITVIYMFKTRPNPKKILVPSSLIILSCASYLQLVN